MAHLGLDSTVTIAEGVVSCDLSGDTALLHVPSGTYFTMNRVGTKVWSLIQHPRPAREVHAVLVECYDVDADDCARDLLQLLNDLSEHRLIAVIE